MAIQQILIRYILEPLARVMENVPQKVKDILFTGAGLAIILQYFGRGSGLLQYRYLIFYVLGCLCLGVMILCTLRKGLKPVVFRKSLAVCWFGVAGFMLLSGVINNIDRLPEAVLLLVAYPVVYLIWANSEGKRAIGLMLRSIELSFVVYLLICLLIFPIQTVRYTGLFNNENGAAGYLALAAVCLLAEILWDEKLSGTLIYRIVLLGICVALLLYTGSRTGLLEFVLVAVTAVAMGIIRLGKHKKGFFARNIMLTALSVLLFFNVTIYAFQLVYPMVQPVYSFVRTIRQELVSPPEASEPSAPTLPLPNTEQPFIRPEDSAELVGNRLNTDDMSADQISTGRITIWKGYLQQLNFLGHSDSGAVERNAGGVIKTHRTSHMTILQIAYENGIIAGVLYLAFNLIAGMYSIIYALRNKNEAYAMIPLMISVAYGVHSLLASTVVSFWYMSTFFYYLVQFPLMVKEKPEDAL